ERVVSLRTYYEIPCSDAKRCAAEGWMTLTTAAKHVGISDRTLRLAIDRGEIEAEHPVSRGPWVLNRRALETEVAKQLVERIRQGQRKPTIPSSQQQTLIFQPHRQ